MEESIQQILMNAYKEIMKRYQANGIEHVYEMSSYLKERGEGMMQEILCELIKDADRAICEEAKKERRADGYTVKERDVARNIFTELGQLEYSRTYYDKQGGGHIYIIDKLLGIDAYDRVDAGVSAKMANKSAGMSYAKSAYVSTEGSISRQTAWNKVQILKDVAHVPKPEKESPESLHIFADEDHVPLQSGKNAIVPLVTICGGKRAVCKGRNELINPVHIHGYGISTDEHWEYVYALASEQYDMNCVKKVYIYGDGGKWISKGISMFPGSIYVYDSYHYEKRMKSLFPGEEGYSCKTEARIAISEDNMALFSQMVLKMTKNVEQSGRSDKEKERKLRDIHKHSMHILDHWESIQANKLKGSIGSCTEAMVSHVLADRLSRNPMGWSKKGLARMAMIRVFTQNGETITPEDIRHGKADDGDYPNWNTYKKILNEHNETIDIERGYWRWFSREDQISCKRTGTKIALDALGKMRDIC
jgi:hypothetical protein